MTEKEELISTIAILANITFADEVKEIYNLLISLQKRIQEVQDEFNIPYEQDDIIEILFDCLPKTMRIHAIYKAKE